MVVAVGLIVGPRAAVVVEDLVRKFGIIVDVVGNRARALFGMPRHKLQRPLQRNERCGLGRDFRRHRGQPARAQQGFDVARERRLDARALRRGDLIAWQRYGTPAYRALECGFDRRRQCAERNGRRQQRQAHEDRTQHDGDAIVVDEARQKVDDLQEHHCEGAGDALVGRPVAEPIVQVDRLARVAHGAANEVITLEEQCQRRG